jgi:hypothetical protein
MRVRKKDSYFMALITDALRATEQEESHCCRSSLRGHRSLSDAQKQDGLSKTRR